MSFISEEIAKGAQAFVSEGVKSFIDKYAKQTSNEYFVYKDGSNKYCDFHISKMNIDGTDFSLVAKYDSYHASVNYMGSYAIENFIAAMLSVETVLASKLADSLDYRRVRAVPGRLDRVESDKGIHVFVDYAHTPDALSKTCELLKPFCKGDLICVFGAGGDRDSGKRPLMAKASEEYSDKVIVTSDNPRTEDPSKILEDIKAGFKNLTK